MTLVKNKPHVGGFILTECDATSCENILKIVYEKKDVVSASTWSPVYEGITRTNHSAIDSGDDYSLRGRVKYAVMSGTHYLEITSVLLEDKGKWRCVVVNHDNRRQESNVLQFIVHASDCSVAMQIVNSDLVINEDLLIDCIVSKCENISSIQYEKEQLTSAKIWIPVYRYITESNHGVCDSETNYTLKGRADAGSRFSRYTLHIKAVILEDHGSWRCVVYDSNHKPNMSDAKEVNIFVPPDIGPTISTYEPPKMVNETYKFTCEVNNIHPEPKVVWLVNGIEYTPGVTANSQGMDGLWFIKNTITLQFHIVGTNQVDCVLGAGDRDPWFRETITFEVKDKRQANVSTENGTIYVDYTQPTPCESGICLESSMISIIIAVSVTAVFVLIIVNNVGCYFFKTSKRNKQDKRNEYYNTKDYYLYHFDDSAIAKDDRVSSSSSKEQATQFKNETSKKDPTYEEVD